MICFTARLPTWLFTHTVHSLANLHPPQVTNVPFVTAQKSCEGHSWVLMLAVTRQL